MSGMSDMSDRANWAWFKHVLAASCSSSTSGWFEMIYDVFDCTDEYTHLYGNNMPNQYFWRKWSWQTTSSSSTISDYSSYLIINPPKISLLAWQILDILLKNVYPQLMSKDKVVLNYAVAWPTLSILLVLCVCLKMGHTLQMNIFNRYNEVPTRFSDRPIWRSAVECKIWTI